jgi:hypothetical protein
MASKITTTMPYHQASQSQKDRRSISSLKNRTLEMLSIGLSLPPTLILALINHTEIWMWLMWASGAILGILWSIRVREWGFLLLQTTYLTINITGFVRLLGIPYI